MKRENHSLRCYHSTVCAHFLFLIARLPTEKTETLHVCIFGDGIGKGREGREKHTNTREIPKTRNATRVPRKYLVHVNRHHWMTLTWYNNYSVASYDSRS